MEYTQKMSKLVRYSSNTQELKIVTLIVLNSYQLINYLDVSKYQITVSRQDNTENTLWGKNNTLS